jgi:hypothetical protein
MAVSRGTSTAIPHGPDMLLFEALLLDFLKGSRDSWRESRTSTLSRSAIRSKPVNFYMVLVVFAWEVMDKPGVEWDLPFIFKGVA